MYQTGLFGSAAVIPQSKFTELCSSAEVVPESKLNLSTFVAWRPLFHKVNLPRCEARRRHFMMTCDIFRTGQTNILALCYLLGKTYKPAHSNAIQVTEINTLDQITGKGIAVSCTPAFH